MNILGLSSRYNDIVADGNERLNDQPLKIGTKTDNDLSFIVNNQEQLKITSSGASIQVDEIQGGADGKIEICGAEFEGCGTIEGEWVQIPNPAVTTEVLADGKPRVNFSASVSDFVMLNNPFTSEDEINISFRVEKTEDSEFTEVAIGYYGATPPLTFSNPSLVFLNYFGVRSRLPFTDQSNTGNGALTLTPTRHQPNTGAWNWNLAGVYRVRFTLVNGVATWFITPPSKREYRVSSCNIALPLFSGGNWIPYVYNSTTGNITSNSHISKETEDIVVDGWDVNEQFNHLNELANNEAVEQLPRVLKVLDQDSNDWKLERKDYEYTLPERSGRLITVDDVAVNDIDTEVIKLEVSENTVRISQAESDIKDLQGETVANANDITNLQSQITSNDTDILNNFTELKNDYSSLTSNMSPIDFSQNQLVSGGVIYTSSTNTISSPFNSQRKSIWTSTPIITGLDTTNYILEFELSGASQSNTTVGFRSDVNDATKFAGINSGTPVANFPNISGSEIRQETNESILYQDYYDNGVLIVRGNIQNRGQEVKYVRFVIANGYLYHLARDTDATPWFNWTLDPGFNTLYDKLGSYPIDITKSYYVGVWDNNTFNSQIGVIPRIYSVNNEVYFKVNTSRNLQTQIDNNDTDILNLQTADTNLQTQIDDNVLEIKANDTDINTLQNSIAELELGTSTVDLTTLNEAVFIEEPSRAYQKAVWSPDYATFNMTFVDNVVTKSTSTDRDSITSQTVLDFTRYNYDILVNLQQVSGSLVHFGFIENELMIDDYNGSWFQVNYAEQGQEWGDGLSARIAYPTATPSNRELSLGFSRQTPSYVSTESFDDLKVDQSLLFSIRNGVLTNIHRRNSPTSPWFNYDFSQFNNGGLANSKLRAFPLKQYRMYFSDGSPDNSSFRAAVTYLEQPNTIYSNELQLRQPIRPDIRRSQYYDNDRTGFQYILSEKNRVITIDTSVYPIYFDGPTQTSLEILVEEDPDSIETDYTVYIKHIGSTNTLNIVSGGLTFQDPAESKIEPWCTTVFRISKAGEEGSPLGAVKTIRKLYSDYNQNFIYFEPTANVSNTRTDFWLSPYGVLGASPQSGWSGRIFIPARAVLTSFVVLADTEAYNTFLTGSFRIQIYKEQADPYAISLTQTGTLIHDRLIKGRNASFIVGVETNTRLVEINTGADPDNINRTAPNLIGISPMGNAVHIVEANSVVSVRAIDWSSFDGSGVELKFYLNYQFI